MKLRGIFWSVAAWTLGTAFPAVVEAACPFCFTQTPFRKGLVWSSIFLLPLPFVIVGILAYWLIRSSRQGPDS